MPEPLAAPQGVPIDQIYFAGASRIRNDYGDVERLAQSLIRRGQLQPIIIRAFHSKEFPDIATDYRYVLVDGGRRLVAAALVFRGEKEIPDVEKGHILAVPATTNDPIFALELEFHANQDRKNFDWKERLQYVNRIHLHYTNLDENWDVRHTAELIQLGERSVYAYLQLSSNPDLLNHPKIQECVSFRTAWRKFQILTQEKKRKKAIITETESPLKRVRKKKAQEAVDEIEGGGSSGEIVGPTTATKFVHQGDCRDWIGQFDDNKFDWIHWDPPYGHEQSGKSPIFNSIEDNQTYARELISDMVPEIYRVLKPGHWFVIWYHPLEYAWLIDLLAGHVKKVDESGNEICKWCRKPWKDRAQRCPPAPVHFWVNPYPNIWVKGRVSDGHDIKRYLLNDHEEFLLCCKVDPETADVILPKVDRSNVFIVKTLPRSARRHVTHKPPVLLAEILDVISYTGEVGLDPGVGSGSILEAAFLTGRAMVGAELDEAYWIGAVDALQKVLDGETQTIESTDVKRVSDEESEPTT